METEQNTKLYSSYRWYTGKILTALHKKLWQFVVCLFAFSAWLEDYEGDIIERLSLKLEAITGLSTARVHCEALQVSSHFPAQGNDREVLDKPKRMKEQ